jgi:hypothetical protein
MAMTVMMMVPVVVAHADANGTDADAHLGIRRGGAQHGQSKD